MTSSLLTLNFFAFSELSWFNLSVLKNPVRILFTVILCFPDSIDKVFPQLVTADLIVFDKAEDAEGTFSVNYQGMIPVLINAIKEQQKQIRELKKIQKSIK